MHKRWMRNQDSNLRPKTSASFYDKTGGNFFFIKNLNWPLLIHWWQWKDYCDNWAHIVDSDRHRSTCTRDLGSFLAASLPISMVITCELRYTPGWFNRDTISGAYKCSDSPTVIRPQSLIVYAYKNVKRESQ